MEAAGLPHGPEMEATGNFTVEGGIEAMAGLLGGHDRPTAMFAMSDESAFGAMRAVEVAGLRVPDDMSSAGSTTTNSPTSSS